LTAKKLTLFSRLPVLEAVVDKDLATPSVPVTKSTLITW